MWTCNREYITRKAVEIGILDLRRSQVSKSSEEDSRILRVHPRVLRLALASKVFCGDHTNQQKRENRQLTYSDMVEGVASHEVELARAIILLKIYVYLSQEISIIFESFF